MTGKTEKKVHPAWWKRVLRTLGLTLVLYFILGALFIMFMEESFIYFPTTGSVGKSPGEDVTLTCSDGVKIHGWWVPNDKAGVSILLFHGNGGNLHDRRGLINALRASPANVMAIDYRGYGQSAGSPSEEGLYLDARAAWDWLAERTSPDRIVIMGKSLGGGPASELASTVECGGLILESTFTSAPDMAGKIMPLFPARFLVRTQFDNLSKVPKINCPKLFIHSRHDEMIPFEMSERLFAAAAEPKESAWFDSGGHNELRWVNGEEYDETIRRFLEKIAGGP